MTDTGAAKITGGIITGGTGTSINEGMEYGGGGIFVGCRATFTMTGGSIVGCTLNGSISNGGGVCVAQGQSGKNPIDTTFHMTGGSILGCKASSNGGGVSAASGSRFHMTDSRIIGCTATGEGGGIYSSDTVYMTDSTVSQCTANAGGGVLTSPNAIFEMEGSSITGCVASMGGGVFSSGSYLMKSDSIISGCVATGDYNSDDYRGGGGVLLHYGTFTMEDGSAIFDCTAKPYCGEGIYVWSNGQFVAKGGSVKGVAVVGHTIKNTSMTGSALFYDGVEKSKNGVGRIVGKLVTFMDGDSMYAQTLAGTTLNGTEYTCGGGKITLPTLTRDGYAFGWYKDSACTEKWDPTKTDEENDASFNVTGEFDDDFGTCTLYAGWTPNTYAVTLHTNGGTINNGTVTGYTYGIGATLPTDVTREGFTFAGWYDNENLTGDPITEIGTTETETKEYWAKWKQTASAYFTITFDPNGGTVDPTSATTDAYGKLTELPTPTRSGSYRFDGWFTEKNGGTAVTVDTVYEAHTTVYAHWTYTGSSGHTYYTIKATAGEGGSITPSGRAAVLYGASKTFTITPNDGYAIADVKVDGKSVGAVKTYTFERVRGDHTIEAVFMKATGNPQTGVDVPFTDVSENDWFYADVAYVYANDLMKGTSETTFSPDVTTTRGMIVTILYLLEGEPTVSDNCPFADVKSGSYYEKAITWAAANEIVSGYGNGKFGPDDAITREQMAVILYRYTQYKGMDVSIGEDTNILSYNDALDISEYAFSAMQWACGESILNGSDGNLMPQGNATRAQVAAILHRFCENILK